MNHLFFHHHHEACKYAKIGDLEMIKSISIEHPRAISGRVLIEAVANDRVELIVWLLNNHTFNWHSIHDAMQAAHASGLPHIANLVWILHNDIREV